MSLPDRSGERVRALHGERLTGERGRGLHFALLSDRSSRNLFVPDDLRWQRRPASRAFLHGRPAKRCHHPQRHQGVRGMLRMRRSHGRNHGDVEPVRRQCETRSVNMLTHTEETRRQVFPSTCFLCKCLRFAHYSELTGKWQKCPNMSMKLA